ncbi:xanthine dehydrogenase family protein subunit M [Sulfitobacter sp. LCG007]
MRAFDYVRATSLVEALEAGASQGARFLAGGTNLLDLMKAGVADPARIVDISRLPELGGIETLEDGSLRIGALVRNADLARDPAFASAFPAICEALLSGASAQIRNSATVGGNLLQQTRCAYFYDPMSACNRRENGAGCDAIGGETAGHAVLGWTPRCIATHASDFCVPLVALDAVVQIAGPDGTRETALADFLRLPDAETPGGAALGQGELVTGLRLPAEARSFAANARYLKLRERTSFAFALVSAAAMLRMEGDRIAEARLALGGVAARPWRVSAAEAHLAGAAPSDALLAEAAALALQGAEPSGENAYKIDLARRVATRALMLATAGTPAKIPALPSSVFAPSEGASAHA